MDDHVGHVARFFEPAVSSSFLFGPRGTGKTTLLRECLPGALFLNLLDPGLFRRLSARPELLRELVSAEPAGRDVVLDEVQRIPDLLHVVHDLMESPGGSRRRFVLTGSSARKLRRGGVDLLAGRAVVTTLHPFMAAELPSFSLDEALELGLVPLVRGASDPAAALSAYATLYLEQEVQAEGIVRNIGNFARFMEVVSLSHAAVLNLSNVARETAVSRKVVQGFVEILEDLLLAYRIPVFTRRAQRQLVSHPKLYLFDAGVFRSLRPRGPLDRTTELDGAALEGLVVQHLRAWIAYSRLKLEMSYWRTRAGREVDVVLYGDSGFWAIEVKNSSMVHSGDVGGLRAFVDDYPESTPLLLYRGRERLRVDGVLCLPVDDFLVGLRPGGALIPA
jgi:predicted AAA+ superfamily ATPase